MSLKNEAEKELAEFKLWAQNVNMQAHLAKSNIQSEVRTSIMEAEQAVAKLEAKLESWGESADDAAKSALAQLKTSYEKLKSQIKG